MSYFALADKYFGLRVTMFKSIRDYIQYVYVHDYVHVYIYDYVQ